MVRLLSDYIVTPLGEGVDANLAAVLDGRTATEKHGSVHGVELVEEVMASLLEEERYKRRGYTLFESVCIYTIENALKESGVDAESERTVFILSSTKGDIWTPIAVSASNIAKYFGNRVKPVVVSAACTSGACAQLTAWRYLEGGTYDNAVVVGCDIQTEFTISGFMSLKAVSPELCKPYDKNRCGLNLGEAVACMVLSSKCSDSGKWSLMGGSIHNDANHISGPSRTAEGSLRCLNDALKLIDAQEVGCISVHGTGTLYNDEMESIAIHRAGLDNVPVSALKGVFGHTMGAAGIMESILTLHAMERGLVLPTKGFEEQGTTYKVAISGTPQSTDKQCFIKLLSGFGGINAAVAWRKGAERSAAILSKKRSEVVAEIRITPEDDIMALYRAELESYPKFFKMDMLSKLGWLGAELLLKRAGLLGVLDSEKTAVVLASRNGSLKNDTDYNKTIEDHGNYYPSPSLFVYTLPNIVAGEIAIKEHIMGETACYLLADKGQFPEVVAASARAFDECYIIAGWVDCEAADKYEADMKLIKTKLY